MQREIDELATSIKRPKLKRGLKLIFMILGLMAAILATRRLRRLHRLRRLLRLLRLPRLGLWHRLALRQRLG